MKKLIIYVADDGTRFDNEENCRRYEHICRKINLIMQDLRPRNNEYNLAVWQDITIVKNAYKNFMSICADILPDFAKTFEKCASGARHQSQASYIISDFWQDFPILDNVNYRFECIDMNTGVEYEQPYFAAHPKEFKGKII